jgi:hypothetical protein
MARRLGRALKAAGLIVLPLALRLSLALAAAAAFIVLSMVVALCWVLSDASRSERLIGMITASRGGGASTAARPAKTQAPRRVSRSRRQRPTRPSP